MPRSKGPLYERYRDAHRTISSPDGNAHLRQSYLVADSSGVLRRLDRLDRIDVHAPKSIALDTEHHFEILKLLECCGSYFASAQSVAAEEGARVFRAARAYALTCPHDWIGVDWDFTTDLYRIYAPLVTLVRLKLCFKRSEGIDEQWLRTFEIAKPGMYEFLFGLAVGYALRQGIRHYGEWNRYEPQVRWVTQTWPSRLALLGTHAIPLILLLAGKFPGETLTTEEVRQSKAFITVESFLAEIHRLLSRFRDSGYRVERLEPYERTEIEEFFSSSKVYQLKPLGAFASKGWSAPSLILDDSIGCNESMHRSGVATIQTLNPIARNKEMSDTQTVCFGGRLLAQQQIVRMASKSEVPAIVESLQRITQGESRVVLTREQLRTLPAGTVLLLSDVKLKLREIIDQMREPQVEVRRRICKIIGELKARGELPALSKQQQP